MRRLTMMSGLAAMACLLAIAAASASAHQFTASAVGKSFPLKLKGTGEEQNFKFGKYRIECERVLAKGSIKESPTNELTLTERFKECVDVEGRFEGIETEPKIKFRDPVEFKYRPNGSTELGAEGEVEVGPITMLIHRTGGCTVVWPRQNVPLRSGENPEGEFARVTYNPFYVFNGNLEKFPPEGYQEKLTIVDKLRAMKYEYGHEGLCENFPTGEQGGARLEGEITAEVPAGNLGWE